MRVGLLGGVVAWGDDGGSVALGGLRVRGLLARLALDAGRTISTPVLVDDLWGESVPDHAANALQALISRLRKAIGAELVQTDARGYRLALDPPCVDARQFEGLVGTGSLAALRSALALWRGPALADLDGIPFAAAAAARLTEQRAAAVEQCARAALAAGDPEPEVATLAAQLEAHPLRETTAALLARALHAAGRQADALAVLDRTAERLVDELGVDPGAEIDAARLAVLRNEPVAQPRSAPLPRRLTSFIGRDDDVLRVRELLERGRLVTLIGPGGAGKTRLAKEAAPTGAARPLVIAELAALTEVDQLPAAVLSAVGGPEQLITLHDDTEPDTTGRLVAAVAAQPMILLLDNCEHLVDGVAGLTAALLDACPRLTVLATSREPLGIMGEVLHPVEPLLAADAVALFVDRAAAVRPGFALDADVEPAVREICTRLDGQPLPIELAAARLRTLTPAEIAARLDDRFRLLTSGARTALPRHQTLRAVVDWSWDLLTEPERAVARRLGAFAGGATVAAAERVCSAPAGPPVDDVFELLASLVDKSLVVAVPQQHGAPTRYRMLETIREYAGERLDEAGERADAVAAHTAFMLELAETAEPHLRGAEQLDWLAKLRAEDDEIDLAMRRALSARDAAVAHRFVAAMGWSYLIRGLVQEADRWAVAVHGLDGPVPAATKALNCTFFALSHLGRGKIDETKVYANQAMQLAYTLPRPWHPMLELLQPVYAMYVDDDRGPLIRQSEDAADPWVRAFAMLTGAQYAENAGLVDEQRKLLRQAHELLSVIGDRFGLGMVVHGLGELEDFAGEYDAAARAYDEAIVLATELSNVDDLPQFAMKRALLEARRGNVEDARRMIAEVHFEEALDDSFNSVGALHIIAAIVEMMAGNIATARARIELAAADFRVTGDDHASPQRQAWLSSILALVEMRAGDRAAARAALRAAVEPARRSDDGPICATVVEAVARFAHICGRHEHAALLLGSSVTFRGMLDKGNPEIVALLEELRGRLGDEAAAAAHQLGKAMSTAEAFTLIHEIVDNDVMAVPEAPEQP
ncbi:BTAD domain-containing putative transcriptional regulator [Pseudonocardia sp. TRM90224]|uniref:BTAD domain-containing putative transcriptional regulator n=1 Tax=Pseudonocardia sp. TRM90224 TaxID=2812678 RepID=UPI001E65E0DC|nr:BTAD domain-containing putative transcriptional regulator [Pseudonocardia sp. TRM90224]